MFDVRSYRKEREGCAKDAEREGVRVGRRGWLLRIRLGRVRRAGTPAAPSRVRLRVRAKTRQAASLPCFVEAGLLYVVGDRGVDPFGDGTVGVDGLADGGGGDGVVDAVEDVEGGAGKDEVAAGGLLFEGLGDVRGGPDGFGQGVGDVGERVTGAAGDDEFAFREDLFGFVPGGDVFEGVDADQKEELVGGLEEFLEAADGVDGVTRKYIGDFLTTRVDRGSFFWGLEQGGQKGFVGSGGERNHGVAMEEGADRLFLLMGRDIGSNEIDTGELEFLAGGGGEGGMTAMDGIEGTAEKADFHGRRQCRLFREKVASSCSERFFACTHRGAGCNIWPTRRRPSKTHARRPLSDGSGVARSEFTALP